MANNFNKVEYKDVDYYMRDSRMFLIESSQVTNTNNWLGTLPEGIDSVTDYDTLIIDYYLKRDSNGQPVTLNLGGGTGNNKKVYLSHADDQVTDEFGAGSVIRLAYISTLDDGNGGWKVVGSDASGSGGSLRKTFEDVVDTASLTGGTQATLTTQDLTVAASETAYTGTSGPDKITSYTRSTPTSASVANGVLSITSGTAETLEIKTIAMKTVDTFTPNVVPTLGITTVDVVKNVEVVEA